MVRIFKEWGLENKNIYVCGEITMSAREGEQMDVRRLCVVLRHGQNYVR